MEVGLYREWNRTDSTDSTNYAKENENHEMTKPMTKKSNMGASISISSQALELLQKQDAKKSSPIETAPVMKIDDSGNQVVYYNTSVTAINIFA